MLEILLLIALCKRIGVIVRDKGRSAGGYQALAVMLWIGGEITGFVFGFSADLGNGAYVTALLGAALGALTAYMIAKSVKPIVPMAEPIGRVFE